MKFKSAIILVGFLSLTFNTKAAPEIGIGSMYDLLMPNENFLVKKVYNSGDSTAFVRVDILEIRIDGNGKEQELIPQKVDVDGLNKQRLIATPQRMIVPPSGFQTLRLLWPGSRDKERYYRVRFTPVEPDKENDFGLSEKQIQEYKNSVKAGVNILTGYGSIMYIMPESPVFNTGIENKGDSVRISNAGNATIVINGIKHCRKNKDDCSESTRSFVIPGRDFFIKKKEGMSIVFQVNEAGKTKDVSM